jgi:hypothetical protein
MSSIISQNLDSIISYLQTNTFSSCLSGGKSQKKSYKRIEKVDKRGFIDPLNKN